MQPKLQRIEIETLAPGNHDLAIEHAARRKPVEKQLMQLGKIPIERPQIAALDEHVGSTAKDNRAKTVPFRFVEKRSALGKLVGQLGEHRLDGGSDGKVSVGRHGSRPIFSRYSPVTRD